MPKYGNVKVFLALTIFYLVPNLIIDFFVLNDTLYFNYFANKVPSEKLIEFLANLRNLRWLGYLLTIIFIFFKTLIVGGILWLGAFLWDNKESLKKLWCLAIIAQLIFAFKGYFLLGQAIFSTDLDLESLQLFSPLSLANLFNNQETQTYWLFLFQSLNLFEVLYWFLLAYLLSKELKVTFNHGLKIVVNSYIPAFVLWLVAVTFFLVSNS